MYTNKQIWSVSYPILLSLLAQNVINVTDTAFLGHVSEVALGASAMGGLFYICIFTIAFGFSTGSQIVIARRNGEGRYSDVGPVMIQGVMFLLLIAILMFGFTKAFGGNIMRLLVSSESIYEGTMEFLDWRIYGFFFSFINVMFRALYIGITRTKVLTINAVVMALTNVILDYALIFGKFGLPEMGIKGAALGTICAQFLALLGVLYHFSSPKSFIRFQKGIFKVRWHIVGGMLAIGLSPFLMNLCSCLIVLLINNGLKDFGGDMYIGAYGIVNRIVFLFIMIVMGFNQGMQPIAGYNFGARQLSRMIQVLKYTTLCAITVTTLGFLICQIFPRTIIRMFTGDSDLIDIAEHGMRLILLFFPLVGFQMVSSSFFQSIGMAGKAIFLSLTRQLIFLLPCLLILPHYWGTDGVWGSIPVADFIASITTGLMLGWQLKKFKTGGLNNAKDSVAL